VLTPIRRQYLAIKKQHPDAILFFRLGDFYETFDEDARLISRELNIVLTGRPMGKGQRVPLAGIPYHAADNYIARLISKGYKVAICEQMQEPSQAKGIVAREVVRVVTPGTLVEPQLLAAKTNNYLAAVVLEQDRAGPSTAPSLHSGLRLRAGIAYADITTGEFAATQLSDSDVGQAVQRELARLQPAEVLLSQSKEHRNIEHRGIEQRAESEEGEAGASMLYALCSMFSITPYEPWHFNLETAQRALLEHFGVATLDGFGLAGMPLAVQAAGAIVQYLGETQRAALSQLTQLASYSTSQFMVLDAYTRRNLEIFETTRTRSVKGSLLGVLDLTQTAMGGRLLRRWMGQPLLDLTQLTARQETIQAFYDNTPLRTEVIALLRQVSDLERLANRAGQHIATPRDLVALRHTLAVVPRLQKAIADCRLPIADWQIENLPEIAALIAQAIVDDPPATLADGGVIRPGFSAELDGLHAASKNAKQWIAGLERQERTRTGIKNLKVGYNKVFGYYIEVTSSNLAQVPADYIRKQTLVGAERFITPDLKEYESLVLNAQERIVELETQVFRQVLDQVAATTPRLLATARALAELDVFAALAEVAIRHSYVRPTLDNSEEIRIQAGRHAVVETTLSDEPFVPNDTFLSTQDAQLIVLTGPNMAGKSTFLRQVALIVLMAQIGCFVPAEKATIGLVDRIFTRVGAQDDIATGQSTFMVEMVETANILHHATRRSLIVLDEIGRGTSTYDGLAIARSVVEFIHNHPRLGAKTLFATHYHELTELAKVLPRVRNFNVAVAEEGDRVVFLRRIVPGGADRSYGIHVAQLAGLPRSVIHRAEEVLENLEKDEKGRGRRERLRQEMAAAQLSMFPSGPHPVVEELQKLDVDSLSPLEALTKLYELQEKAKGGAESQ
jgi:DNA mismatch repair protein MutS